ncbi:MAG: hypothetical protein ACR2QA_18490, partial [Solirubrobacteraceae bacterium]
QALDGDDNRDISLMIAMAHTHILRGQESGSLAQARGVPVLANCVHPAVGYPSRLGRASRRR